MFLYLMSCFVSRTQFWLWILQPWTLIRLRISLNFVLQKKKWSCWRYNLSLSLSFMHIHTEPSHRLFFLNLHLHFLWTLCALVLCLYLQMTFYHHVFLRAEVIVSCKWLLISSCSRFLPVLFVSKDFLMNKNLLK